MNKEQNFRWIEQKLASCRFDGSILKYVNPSEALSNNVTQLEPNSTLVKLDSNENFFISLDYLKGIFDGLLQNVDLRLYNPDSIAELKEALGAYENISPNNITVSSGSEQLVDLITRIFLEKGDNAISVEPTFFMYDKRVKLNGANLVKVPLKEDLSLDIDAILEKITHTTKLLFICSPNNPTGNQFDLNELESLVDECPAIVVIDEAYADFADYSSVSLSTTKKNVIVLKTFSKAFGLAGMRFGYAVANPDISSVLSETIPYTVNIVTSKYVVKLLKDTSVIKTAIKQVKAERKQLITELKALNGIEVFDSKANFVTFRPQENAEIIHKILLEKGIRTKNLGDLPVIGHCLRVTVGLPDMNTHFVDTLKQILD